MERNQNADLLGVFSYIFAGIQGLALLFIGAYGLMMFGMLAFAAINDGATKPELYIVPGIIAAIFLVMSAFGLTVMILNIKLGRALRSHVPPSQTRVVVTSIFNICSFFCGGILVLPFGIALGIFGIVFALSDNGKAYLNGETFGGIATPPPPIAYPSAQSGGQPWQ